MTRNIVFSRAPFCFAFASQVLLGDLGILQYLKSLRSAFSWPRKNKSVDGHWMCVHILLATRRTIYRNARTSSLADYCIGGRPITCLQLSFDRLGISISLILMPMLMLRIIQYRLLGFFSDRFSHISSNAPDLVDLHVHDNVPQHANNSPSDSSQRRRDSSCR